MWTAVKFENEQAVIDTKEGKSYRFPSIIRGNEIKIENKDSNVTYFLTIRGKELIASKKQIGKNVVYGSGKLLP